MTNEKNNVYYVSIKNGFVESFTIDSEIASKFDGDTKEYPIKTFQAFVGVDINYIHEDGSLLSLKELIEKGYVILKENEIYDEEKNEVREKTEIEKFRENPTDEKIIETDEQGNEYIREKTILEKYNDELVTKDEYNKYQTEQRANKYQNTTDPMYQTLSVRKLRGDISDDDYVLETEKIEAMILKVKAEFPYVE